jgi:hypothetical protein
MSTATEVRKDTQETVMMTIIAAFTLLADATDKVAEAFTKIISLKETDGFDLSKAAELINRELKGDSGARADVRTLLRILFIPGVGLAVGDDWVALHSAVRKAKDANQRHACVRIVEEAIAAARVKNSAYTMSLRTATEKVNAIFVKHRPVQAPEITAISGAKSLKNSALKMVELAKANPTIDLSAQVTEIITILSGIVTPK